MKRIRLTNKKRRVQRRLAARRFQKKLRERIGRARKRYAAHKLSVALARNTPKIVSEPKTENPQQKRRGQVHKDLLVPQILNLTENYNETVEFIRTLRSLAVGLRRPVRLVFSETKEISPEALLLLLAELYRCRKIFGQRRVTGTYPKDKKIERIMEASGFFELLEVVPRNPIKDKRYPLSYIKFITGSKLIESSARALREALLGENIKMGEIAKKRLYRAITEAMINVVQHAYPKNQRSRYKLRNSWWMSGHVNQRTGKLVILFCDLGVGIPTTLPKVHGWEKIRAALSILPGIKPNDAQMIMAGMEIGRTSTGLEGRGKGLNDLKRFVDDTGGGELCIFSRKGHYKYEPGKVPGLRNYNVSICGTLIKWSVPIANVTDWISEAGDSHGDNY